jgi:hypothetical protein
VKVRIYFHIKQLHQLELDSTEWPEAPQNDAYDFADWVDDAGWRVHDDLLGRIDSVRSWVDTEDEIDIQSAEEVTA